MFRQTLSIMVIVLHCLFAAADAKATTRHVSPQGADGNPGTVELPLATIQHAVGMAAEGDTIMLLDGRYEGPGNVDVVWYDKGLAIRSLSGDREACVIACGGSNGLKLRVNAAVDHPVHLDGFTITGADTSVCISDDRPPTNPEFIPDLTISNCRIIDGNEGICLPGGTLDMEATTVARQTGNAISMGGRRHCVLTPRNCEFRSNGVAVRASSLTSVGLQVTNTTIAANGDGCILNADVLSADFRDSHVDSSTAGNGILVSGFTYHLDLFDCSISGNMNHGVALVRPDSFIRYFSATRCRISHNRGWGIGSSAPEYSGMQGPGTQTALDKRFYGTVELESSEIHNNALGGAILGGLGQQTVIEGTSFIQNGGAGLILADNVESIMCSVMHSTFAGNAGDGLTVSRVHWTASHLLIADNDSAAVNLTDGATVDLVCSNLHGNLGGDWTAAIADQLGQNGNTQRIPLFCDPASGDYHLQANSPLAAANNPCGTVGSFDVGCPAPVLSCRELHDYDPVTGACSPVMFDIPVTIEGVVFVAPGTYSENGGGFLQDDTGGINFWRWPAPEAVRVGDRIRLIGPIWPDLEMLYVGTYAYTKLDSLLAPVPVDYSVAALLGDYRNAGSHVRVTGRITGLTTDSFRLTDGPAEIEVRRSDYAGVSFSPLSEGVTCTVVSPCFKEGAALYLMPASQAGLAIPNNHHVAIDGDDAGLGTWERPYRTLQRAVDAASSGDTVLIHDGTYEGTGNVDVVWYDKSLAIRSLSGDRDACVIACGGRSGLRHVVTSATDTLGVSLDGFSITDAATSVSVSSSGALFNPGLVCGLAIANCRFIDGGTGVYLYGHNTALNMENTTVARQGGRGISVFGFWSDLSLRECELRSNGVGIQLFGQAYAHAQVSKTTISHNAVGCMLDGDGLFTSFQECRVDSNTAGYGIRSYGFTSSLRLEDCSVSGNANHGVAFGNWGGNAGLYVTRCEISRNQGLGIDRYYYVPGDNYFQDLNPPTPVKRDQRSWFNLHSSQLRNNTLGGATLSGYACSVLADSMTFVDNGGPGLALWTYDTSTSFSMSHSTIAGNAGHGITADGAHLTASHLLVADNDSLAIDLGSRSTVDLACSDLYGNLGGDWTPPIADQLGLNGNFSADPYFCALPDTTYAIAENSPCAPGNNPDGADCGLIGARGVGCGPFVPPTLAQFVPLPAGNGPVDCGDTAILGFHYTPGTYTPALRGYSVRVTADAPVTFTPADFSLGLLPPGTEAYFQAYENAPNDCTVDFTILGAESTGIAAEEDLFTVSFHGADDGLAGVRITHADFRDLQNQPFTVEHATPASIIVDCGPPPPVAAVTAEPSHRKVTLSWTDPVTADLASIRILRGMWCDEAGDSAYPLYGRLVGCSPPARPDSLAAALATGEWTVVADVAPGAGSFTDEIPARGIYFYEIFAVDAVGNASARSAAAAKTTNYWLGDVAMGGGDGYVNIFDMSALGDSYGVSAGHPSFSPLADVGPTDTATGDGVPLPDGLVAFEDLMIFGQNFGEVGPAKAEPRPLQDLMIVWRQESAHEWSCRLAEPCADLRGLRVTAGLPAGEVAVVTAGALLSQQGGPVFLKNAGADLDVGLCLMGRDLGFEGDGELFRVTLTGEVDLSDAGFEARSIANRPLLFALTADVADAVPLSFAAGPSYPNPFNATTTIQFDLPEPQRAEVSVYSIDGRRVKTLLSQLLPAGHHTVPWTGSDDGGGAVASGTYFYRIEAGPYRSTQKMVLAK